MRKHDREKKMFTQNKGKDHKSEGERSRASPSLRRGNSVHRGTTERTGRAGTPPRRSSGRTAGAKVSRRFRSRPRRSAADRLDARRLLHHVCMLPWTYLVPGVPERLVHGVHDDRSSKEGPHFQLRPHLVARAHLDLGGRKSRQTSNAHDVDVKRTNRMWSGAHLAMPRMSFFKRFANKRRSTRASAVSSASATPPPPASRSIQTRVYLQNLERDPHDGKGPLGRVKPRLAQVVVPVYAAEEKSDRAAGK